MCEHKNCCVFFSVQLSNMPQIAAKMRQIYCNGNYHECARYGVARLFGKEMVPDDLYPNETDLGRVLDVLTGRDTAGNTP